MYKILCIVSIIFVIVFILFNLMCGDKTIEGLENNAGATTINDSQNATIQAKILQLDDQLMITKNKKQYENMIINMDDYINLMMIQQLVKTKFDSGADQTIESLNQLNILKSAKDSLNVAMKILDKR